MNENINLVELLKDCPEETKLYSPLFGEVCLSCANSNLTKDCPILVYANTTDQYYSFRNNGTIYFGYKNGEIMLYPSKDQRDWSKWKCPKLKFNPKTLKPFEKVLVSEVDGEDWICELFSYRHGEFCVVTGYRKYRKAIPYNEDTKHLVGTSDEAPEYYRYWEDYYRYWED